jgi:hypothetical protein
VARRFLVVQPRTAAAGSEDAPGGAGEDAREDGQADEAAS